MNLCFTYLTPFASILSGSVLGIWIHKAPEYGSGWTTLHVPYVAGGGERGDGGVVQPGGEQALQHALRAHQTAPETPGP